jgi:glycosyltransferase involved in cell wall biosynthesis
MKIVRYYPRAFSGDGGMTNAVRRSAAATAAAGAEVTLVYDAGAGIAPAASDVEWRAVRHASMGPYRMPLDIESVLAGADVLVLHSAWSPHNNRAAAVARRLGIPYVLEPRGEYDPNILGRRGLRKRVWWRAYERDLVLGARTVHLFFETQRAHVEVLGYGGPFVVAPNGVEVPAEVRWDGGTGGYVLWMGRFDPEHKGLDLLIRAVALLPPNERPSVRLHGPDRRGGKQRMRALIDSLGLQDDVIVGEPVYGAAKWELLSRAAAFVYPSRWEGFGNSLAEAAAIGVPCLTTPYPLGRALAERGGALIADPTPDTLADGLCKITSSGAHSIGEAGARYVTEELAWDRVARSWLHQVEAVL